jgi:hypothetical protein
MSLGAGPVGSLDFNTNCDWSVRFVIDNYLSVRHYLDDDTDLLGLTAFDGVVSSVVTNGQTASVVATGLLGRLNKEVSAKPNATATFLRTIELPTGEVYNLNGVDYRTGGDRVVIDGIATFVESPRVIYDMEAFDDRLYVLAQGGAPVSIGTNQSTHAVVYEFDSAGGFIRVWAVYSDVNDVNGQSTPKAIAVGFNDSVDPEGEIKIFVGQNHPSATRVQQFDHDGTFIQQFGATGSLDTQFQDISGIAVPPATGVADRYWVADKVSGRIQGLDATTGALEVSYNPTGTEPGVAVDIDFLDNSLLVVNSDPGEMLMYSITSSTFYGSVGTDRLTTGVESRVGSDSLGRMYAFQDGKAHVFTRVNQNFGAGTESIWLESFDGPAGSGKLASIDKWSGTLFWADDKSVIHSYTTVPSSLTALFLYYIGLAVPNMKVNLRNINIPEIPYLNSQNLDLWPWSDPVWAVSYWTGNAWEKICELAALSGNEVFAVGDTIYVSARGDRSFELPSSAIVSPLTVSNERQVARFEARALDARWINYVSLNASSQDPLYHSHDDGRIFTCDVGSYEIFVVPIEGEVLHVLNVDPGPTVRAPDILSEGSGIVIRSGKFTTQDFYDNGGKIEAWPGKEPGTLEIAITGPAGPFTSPTSYNGYPTGSVWPVPGPYEFRNWNSYTSEFVVQGIGIRNQPVELRIGTGAPEQNVGTSVTTLDSPFFINQDIAMSEMVRAAYATNNSQRIQVTIPLSHIPPFQVEGNRVYGSHSFINSVFFYLESEYIVVDATQDAGGIVLVAERYNIGSHSSTSGGIDLNDTNVSGVKRFNEIWNGTTASQFEQFWDGYSSGEFDIAPLMNPFGYN